MLDNEKIRSNEFLFSSLIHNSYESIIIVDNHGSVYFANKGFEKLYSTKLERIIGRNIKKFNPKSRLTNVLKTGRHEILFREGTRGNKFLHFLFPIKDNGRLVGAAEKSLPISSDRMTFYFNQIKQKQIEGENNSIIKYIVDTEFSRYGFEDIIGQSEPIQNAKLIAQKAAISDATILIVGESGTGKELFAHAIHRFSNRSDKTFVRVNCSCLPLELIEAELFGYEPGSFTGADKRGKIGKFEYANGGTIFLDEIGDMPLNMQAKLLRVIEDKEILKIGSNHPKNVDFRLISATNQNLDEMVKNQTFRLDLLFRLNVLLIKSPPLRQIKEDIPLMAKHFLKQMKNIIPKKTKYISDAAMDVLFNYDWPGNARELRNVIERSYVVCGGEEIELNDLPSALLEPNLNALSPDSICKLKETLEKAEKQAIIAALKICNNEKKATAELLDIHRTGLYQKIKKYDLG
ncbi:MAG: sigma 54-interacting transcriptional regulator [Deltaproteobacteria bacterium]|nr:sigma 54-interacting transcriptional regulator [Deltaproteobacteria bacterium]